MFNITLLVGYLKCSLMSNLVNLTRLNSSNVDITCRNIGPEQYFKNK